MPTIMQQAANLYIIAIMTAQTPTDSAATAQARRSNDSGGTGSTPGSPSEASAANTPSNVERGASQTLALLAELLAQPDLSRAATALAEALAHNLAASRVSVGLRGQGDRGACRLCAFSAGPLPERANRTIDAIADAMDEALDQGAAVQLPQPAAAPPRIALAQAALLKLGAGAVYTIPLVAQRSAFGAVCIEWPQTLPTPAALRDLEHQICLLAPVLALYRQGERSPWQQSRDAVRRGLARLGAPGAGRLRYSCCWLDCWCPSTTRSAAGRAWRAASSVSW
jgi:hypothetical protein